MVQEILEENNITYKKEVYIFNQIYRIDFICYDKIVIEVQGDYWHANPLLFDYSKINNVQKKNVTRDIAKKKVIEDLGLKYFEIWEYDLKNNYNQIKNKLIEYVQNNI